MTIQLANRSIVQPLGVLEDVLIQVNELIFLANFYVLDMEDETSGKESTLILGRPFLMTARMKIDVHAGTLSTKFGDTLVQFNIFEAMKHPTEDHSLFGIDMIEELVEEYFQPDNYSEDIKYFTGSIISCLEADQDEVQESPNSKDNYNDVADLAFEVELTELLDQLPVIISNNLLQEQEDKLLKVLRQHKKAIGWKLLDLPSINPSICMHRILIEEEVKFERQQQRRLNPTILDVVRKEVSKLLAARIIYPISDSQWVSPMQVLEKLSRKSHYYFLDGFSGYMQIHIAPENQYKTTFTCPFGTFAYTCMPFGLCNAPSPFQHRMTSIFSYLLQYCMEVFDNCSFSVILRAYQITKANYSIINP
ncbi:Orf V, partial [Mucuna pruriens]